MLKKCSKIIVTFMVTISSIVVTGTKEVFAATTVDIQSIENVTVSNNIVTIAYNDGLKGKITFLENDIFRVHIDPTNNFNEYATPNSSSHTGKIQKQSDSSDDYTKPRPSVSESGNVISITSGKTVINLNKNNGAMSIKNGEEEVLAETHAIQTSSGVTRQYLKEGKDEHFYGGGTQNGRFAHKGESINIVNEGGWTDGGVASPNPFYWSTKGYGVLRNTFKPGKYDFGKTSSGQVVAQHNESQFDAYYFLGSQPTDILKGYFKVTGDPVLLPEYAYYLGHLNCYNRDSWTSDNLGGGSQGWLLEDGNTHYEYGRDRNYKLPIDGSGKIPTSSPYIPESLNGTSPLSDRSKDDLYKYSARAVIDGYEDNDMPLGYLLPNDGYGCGYGQSGYYEDYPLGSSTNIAARDKAIDENVDNLKQLTEYANNKGVATGLWTQSGLDPDSSAADSFGYHGYQTLRDFKKEVNVGGITTLKTDVAWVGSGYSFGLNATKTAFEGIGSTNTRPNIISLDGWAGSQRHAGIWTGDQTGGNWEYIRFHIPTYIGQSLSGNPNIGSDIDGIFGGSPLITTRDLQWKTFTPLVLEMDGWGKIPKKPYGYTDDHEDINRSYLKLKSQLMPYLYTTAQEATDGLPMIRAMFLEYPGESKAYGKDVQYQFMYGSDFLVAPVYQDTQADSEGNDVRSGIFLPDSEEMWIDYFTGEKYRGGQTLLNFDAPLWKLPLFVKSGAIVPMYEANNNPSAKSETNKGGLDKSNRIVEFYPDMDKDSSYTSYEDDGMYMDGVDEQGNEKSQVSYGGNVKTTFTSKVEDDTATLIAEKSKGTYSGYNSNKKTEFIVNMTAKPETVNAFAGVSNVELQEAKTEEEYNALTKEGKGTYFYNEAPDLNKFSQGDGEFAKTKITTTPKLYVTFPRTNVQSDEQKLVIKGYENDDNLGKDELNSKLETPQFEDVDEDKDTTPTSVSLNWNAIKDASNYELLVDGEVFTAGVESTNFLHQDLEYNSTHTYQIRARNSEGYSDWSKEITVSTKLDPWRNVPEGITDDWTGGSYGGNDANRAYDLSDSTFFHSSGSAIDKGLVLDMKEVYQLDKFEYRDRQVERGNGTVYRMDLYLSLDGQHWEKVWDGNENDPWPRPEAADAEPPVQTIPIDNVSARYVKIVTKSSGGNFLVASRLLPYKTDGSKSYPLGDITLDGEVDDGDVQQIEQYKGAIAGDGIYESQVLPNNADINKNGVFDVHDYSFVMTQIDDGTTKTGTPKGSILADLDGKETVKAGETFDILMKGTDLENINSLGAIFEYDNTKYEFVKVTAHDAIKEMTNFTSKSGVGIKEILTVSYNNRGNKALVSGNKDLVTITMKAREDGAIIYPKEFMLVGPQNNLNTVNVIRADEVADKTALEEAIKSAEKIVTEGDKLSYTVTTWDAFEKALKEAKEIFENEDTLQHEADKATQTLKTAQANLKGMNLKPDAGISEIMFKNDQLTEENDGSALWQQDTWKKMMFDGVTSGGNALLEFKWKTENSDIGAEVKLPTDFIYNFDGPRSINTIKVYNRLTDSGNPGNNGCITSIEAKGYTAKNEEIDLGSYDKAEKVFDFTYQNDEKPLLTKVVITPKTSIGTATGTETGSVNNRMLSIYEVEILERLILNTDIYDLLVAEISTLDLDKYTTETRENLEKVLASTEKIVKNTNKQADIDKAVQDLAAAKDALVDKAEMTVEKLTEIVELAHEKDIEKALYTQDSWMKLQVALGDAELVIEEENPTTAQIEKAYYDLKRALEGLELRGSNAEQPSSEYIIDQSKVSLFHETSFTTSENQHGDLTIDGDNNTIWHSNYGAEYKLPQGLVIDLGSEYEVEQVNLLPRQSSKNGYITHYRIEVAKTPEGQKKNNWTMDDLDFVPVVEGYFSDTYDKTEKEIKFDATEARFVKVTALGSLGDTTANNDKYASIAELNFFGKSSITQNDLEKLIDSVDNMILDGKESLYTTSSWKELIEAHNDAKELDDGATSEVIKNAYIVLETAKNALERRATSEIINSLSKLIDECKTLKDSGLYTEGEFAEVQVAMDMAEALLKKGKEDISETDAQRVFIDLALAKANLKEGTDVNEALWMLEIYLEVANDTLAEDLSNIRPGKVQALKDAVAIGQALVDGQSEDLDAIANAMVAIEKALTELWEIVDKTALTNLITSAEQLDPIGYTEATWKALEKAIKDAKVIAENKDATTIEVNNAYQNLIDAINGLEKEVVLDKEKLAKEIALVENMVKNIDKYIPSSVKGLQKALDDAKDVYENATTQKEINDALNALVKERLKARLKPDTSALSAMVAKAEKIDLSKYTDESAEVFEKALAKAKTVLDNPEATAQEVDAAMKELQTSITELETLGSVLGDTHTPDGTGTGSGNSAGGNSTGGNSTGSGAKTGDATNVNGLLGLLVLAGASLMTLKKRKKIKE